MLRNMVTSFFGHERIETTDAKAKELRKLAEKMITLGKQGNLHARRSALAVIKDKTGWIHTNLQSGVSPRRRRSFERDRVDRQSISHR
jgi:large subunit ribosomal protein L17